MDLLVCDTANSHCSLPVTGLCIHVIFTRELPIFHKISNKRLSVFLYANLAEITQWGPTQLRAWSSHTETGSVIAQVLLPWEIQLKLNACDTQKLPL